VKDPQSQNRYAYVRNNPITRVDPNGMSDIDCFEDIDPFCDPCSFDPLFCGVGGGSGGFVGGGGGGGQAKPRPFPWPLLPPGFFNDNFQGGVKQVNCTQTKVDCAAGCAAIVGAPCVASCNEIFIFTPTPALRIAKYACLAACAAAVTYCYYECVQINAPTCDPF
jgi:hypothetical protein